MPLDPSAKPFFPSSMLVAAADRAATEWLRRQLQIGMRAAEEAYECSVDLERMVEQLLEDDDYEASVQELQRLCTGS